MTLNDHKAALAAFLAGLLVLGACGSADETNTTATTTTSTSNTTIITPTTAAEQVAPAAAPEAAPTTAAEDPEPTVSETIEPAGSVEGGSVRRAYVADEYPTELTGIIDGMIADLAGRLAVAESAVTVVSVDDVTWADASLGCPQPGMSYAQVETDGMRVILEAAGDFYDYRSGGHSEPFLCVPAPVSDKSTAGLYELTEDGVVQVEPPTYDEKAPTEGINPPDE